ncbi:MAG TPA: transaldolase [Pseudoclavibacter sp.]|nr:transaldolase [Pseudoclavibacter sp.]
MTQNTNLADLAQAGVSTWLDDLSRERIRSGSLHNLIATHSVVGVTTNPTIFANALSHGDQYAEQVAQLAEAGASIDTAVFELTTGDVAAACEIFTPVYQSSDGADGRVSIEVEPGLARDTEGTIAAAKKLWAKVSRPNAMIKVPATVEGLPAITAITAAGISVNVTLIFSLDRYREVINAYFLGLEKAKEAGVDLSTIHSVASFFVSRVDTEVDARLTAIGTPEALALTGKTAVANARLAYQVFEQSLDTERWRSLAASGANLQRPLWASTGVKDPALPDTTYVVELVAPHVVNTMPEKTLRAVADHGAVRGDTITSTYEESEHILNAVADLGISYDDVTSKLESEGVDKFIVSWNDLLTSVRSALEGAK